MTSPQRHQRHPGVHPTMAQLGIRLTDWTSMGGVPSGIPDCSRSPIINRRAQPSAELLSKKHLRVMGGVFRTCTLVCSFTFEWLLNSVAYQVLKPCTSFVLFFISDGNRDIVRMLGFPFYRALISRRIYSA